MFRTRSRTQPTPAAAAGDAPGVPSLWRRFVWVASPRERALRIGALGLLALGLGAAIAPWTVSRGALREEIAAQLRSSSGLYVFASGPSTFSLLPHPSISLDRVMFVDPRGALVIEAERLAGQIRWLPLLAGRLELDRAEIVSPRLTVDIDGHPMTAAGAAARAAGAKPATPEAIKADAARLGTISFVDGTAVLRRRGQTVDEIDHIDATLDWRTISAPAALDGEATWRGQRGAISLWIARPSDLLRGDGTPMTLQISAPALKLSATGSAISGPRPQFDGRIVASCPSMRDLVGLLGGGVPLPATLGAASLDARTDASPTAVNFSALRLSLDGADYEGALAWRMDDTRPQLSGTLATKSIDLREALRYMPALVDEDGHFSREPILWRERDAFDLDLRLSAVRATWDRMQAHDVAGAILLKDGRLEASLADASLYKGDLKARVVLGADDKGTDFKANIQARGIDWSALGWDRFGDSHLSGAANAHLTVEGSGASFDQIARALSGHGDIDLSNGDILGLDVERALRRIDKKPLASAIDIRNGRTTFDHARVSATIVEGVATIEDAAVEGESFAINLSGAAQIAERQMNLRALVSPTNDSGQSRTGALGFSFDIVGAWDHPDIVPDARGLIRRSGAAQPLFTPRAEENRKE